MARLVGHRDAVGVDGVGAVLTHLPVGETREAVEHCLRGLRNSISVVEVNHWLVLKHRLGERFDPLVLVHVLVVDFVAGERLGDGRRVVLAVVTQVEARELELEGRDLAAQRVDVGGRHALGVVRPEARRERVEVGDEFVGFSVPPGPDVTDSNESFASSGVSDGRVRSGSARRRSRRPTETARGRRRGVPRRSCRARSGGRPGSPPPRGA